MMNTSRDEGRALFEITEAQVQRGAAGMMQRAFVTELRRVNKIERLRNLLVALLREHEPDGTIPTNGRFLFYELVQRGHLSKKATGGRRADQHMIDALKDIRDDGQIPWNWLVDETRSIESYIGYRSVREGALAFLPILNSTRGAATHP